jgi:hypothetical protein
MKAEARRGGCVELAIALEAARVMSQQDLQQLPTPKAVSS